MMSNFMSCLQLADILEDKAQTITEKTPQLTEDLQSKAEEHAGRVADQARPMADQASGAIEGGAKRVANGMRFKAKRPYMHKSGWRRVGVLCDALWGRCRFCSLHRHHTGSLGPMRVAGVTEISECRGWHCCTS